jgi:hypothetical protein
VGADAHFELFNEIAGAGSAKVRRYVMEHSLKAEVRFRNVVYPEVVADLVARGGAIERLPALWDGERLVEGAEAVIAKLAAWSDVGRS